MPAVDENTYALRPWRARFRDPLVERHYRAWRIEASVPFNRMAAYLAIGTYVMAVSVGFTFGDTRLIAITATLALPALLAMMITLRATFTPRLRRWLFPLVTAGAMYAGLVISAGTHRMSQVSAPGAYQIFFGWVVFMTFFGFVLVRLPPLNATCVVAPQIALAIVLWTMDIKAGRAPTGSMGDVAVFVAAFASGFAMNVLIDMTSRRLFRQERIIEAQQEVIARSEALLKKELGHQVAERSRELGTLLARADGPAFEMDLSPGARFDARYRIVRQLGAGGMGTVFEVERVTDGQTLALKVVTNGITRASALRFTREAEIGARVRHGHLVPIVDVGVAPNGAPFLVMDLVKGASLEERRDRFGEVDWALPILRQIADGLSALHAAGIVHRDLKPGNVLLEGDADAPHARISDFGISRIDDDAVDANAATAAVRAQPALTGTGTMLGTPLYMAPEMGRKGRTADRAVDVFALGIVAYELLTGRTPFKMPPVILAMAEQPLPAPTRIDGLPAAIGDTIMSCLHADPEARPSASTVLAVLTTPIANP